MTKKKLLFLAFRVLAIVAVAACLMIWLTVPTHRINKESLKLIREGMSQEEIAAILGAPPDSVKSDRNLEWEQIWQRVHPGYRIEQWTGEDIVISVVFDSTGRAEGSPQASVRQTGFFLENKHLGGIAMGLLIVAAVTRFLRTKKQACGG
jgi:outer membrane protein assembly factor BamE (lipoprotein component of BamABCDE complex)